MHHTQCTASRPDNRRARAHDTWVLNVPQITPSRRIRSSSLNDSLSRTYDLLVFPSLHNPKITVLGLMNPSRYIPNKGDQYRRRMTEFNQTHLAHL